MHFRSARHFCITFDCSKQFAISIFSFVKEIREKLKLENGRIARIYVTTIVGNSHAVNRYTKSKGLKNAM